ncbi:ZYRO0D05434p [Zygosaccharomyces rouxii]|uniref:ZYRO0D05434p n=1 Tax=Zygosaccharomyces rouxii (strain ATCC 2623 / CBS 732 / NBRC 1130 / NCYC 568 / NRRL Y-229) TaxID=559307 RepID=C5DVB8_ZYGRC|nr:uncharacterized protein ZYRO0D05434g [Zygosaccharomyces rouxii]KAH9200650.1 hypothetical protein LQ764DRAFT_97322 [Zygosaccharomyces rouxii]CAR27737.1 ZYRO0D05434p [Zygosaccharomyces rouxii]
MSTDGLTEKKLEQLSKLYRDIVPASPETESFYLEILVSCEGNLEAAVELINDSLGVQRTSETDILCAKGKHEDEAVSPAPKVQKSLNSFIKDPNNKIKSVSEGSLGKISNRAIELFTKEDIETNIKYVSVHKNVLPELLANSLLKKLSQDNDSFTPNQFYLFGKKCTSNHLTKMFSSSEEISAGNIRIYYNSYSLSRIAQYDDDLKMAQLLIEDLVNDCIAQRDLLPYQIRSPNWKGDVVLVNRYYKESNLDWHSDKMTSIGPQPIIASLSLGCSREFRVRKNYPSNSQIYIIRPPHNTLVIMHAGFQEEYRHCVHGHSKNSPLKPHPISGHVRINLTYRCYLRKFLDRCPKCKKCGSPMDLRRAFKDPKTRGQYIWQCSKSYTGQECGGVIRAKFDNDSLTVQNFDEEGSRWLAPDDQEAHSAQDLN